MKKTINITLNVLQYLFLFICALVIILTLTAKKNNDGSSNIFNFQMRLVTTDSMAKSEFTDVSNFKIKSIPKNSLIFIELVPDEKQTEWYEQLKEGDVLTFKYAYTEQVTITHRIIDIKNNNGNFIITLEGDNKTSQTNLMNQVIDTSKVDSPNFVIGKVTGKSIVLGLLISMFKKPVSLILIIIVPCAILIIFEILKIMKVINIDKVNKEKELVLEKDAEIELLKNKLKQLEKSNDVS